MRKSSLCVLLLLGSAGALPAAGPAYGPAAAALAGLAGDIPAPPLPAGVKEWTIMVYVNGKNNLELSALDDMNEMERVGSSDKVNVVVELGRRGAYSVEGENWKGVRRYLAVKDADPYLITSPVAQDLGRADMGDWRHLVDFGRWAKAAYPAKKYMLIVWNHGSGWRGPLLPGARGISYDDETRNHISTPQLALALREIGRLDIYASDACLMQMAEVAYEIRDAAQYIVGSEETEPAAGYPYDTLLAPLTERPTMTPEELSRLTADVYAEYYSGKKTASTCSVLKASAVEGLLGKVNEFAMSMMLCGDKDVFRAARKAALNYAFEDNVDLYDLAELVSGLTRDAAVAEKARELMAYISGELVLYNRVTLPSEGGGDYSPWKRAARGGSRGFDRSRGIAIYSPQDAYNAAYGELAWSGSKWPRFIAWYGGGGN